MPPNGGVVGCAPKPIRPALGGRCVLRFWRARAGAVSAVSPTLCLTDHAGSEGGFHVKRHPRLLTGPPCAAILPPQTAGVALGRPSPVAPVRLATVPTSFTCSVSSPCLTAPPPSPADPRLGVLPLVTASPAPRGPPGTRLTERPGAALPPPSRGLTRPPGGVSPALSAQFPSAQPASPEPRLLQQTAPLSSRRVPMGLTGIQPGVGRPSCVFDAHGGSSVRPRVPGNLAAAASAAASGGLSGSSWRPSHPPRRCCSAPASRRTEATHRLPFNEPKWC